MSAYKNTVNDPDVLVSLGSPSFSAGDTVEFGDFSIDYDANGDLSATDLLKVTVGANCNCTFQAANGGQLKLTCNRTSTGAFWNRSPSRRIDVMSTGSTGVIYKIHQVGAGPLYISACKPNTIYAVKGSTFIAGDVDVATLEVENGASAAYRKTGAAFAATTINNRGRCQIENDFGTLNQYDGEAIFNDTSITPTAVNAFGGTLTMIKSGTIGAMTLNNCLIDWSQCKYDVTVSGTTAVGPGVRIRLKRGGMVPVWTLSSTSADPTYEYVD